MTQAVIEPDRWAASNRRASSTSGSPSSWNHLRTTDASQTTSVTSVPFGANESCGVEMPRGGETRAGTFDGRLERHWIGTPELTQGSLPQQRTAGRATPLRLVVDSSEDVVGERDHDLRHRTEYSQLAIPGSTSMQLAPGQAALVQQLVGEVAPGGVEPPRAASKAAA